MTEIIRITNAVSYRFRAAVCKRGIRRRPAGLRHPDVVAMQKARQALPSALVAAARKPCGQTVEISEALRRREPGGKRHTRSAETVV